MAVNQPARPVIGTPNGTGGTVNEWDLKYYDDIWGPPGQNNSGGSNPATTGITVYGDSNSRGAENAARNNASIYYGSSQQIGQDAQEYRDMIKGKVGQKSAAGGRMVQVGNQDIARANAKAGLKGVDTTAASIRERRGAIAKGNEIQQQEDQTNLSNYGKSIGASIAGTESLAAAGAGRGTAATPTPTPSYGGFLGSIICAELYSQGKLNLRDLAGSKAYKETISQETYEGYLVIAKPIVKLMKRSDKFSNLFIGWAKSISVGKPNLFTRIMIPLCFCIGKIKKIEVKDAIVART